VANAALTVAVLPDHLESHQVETAIVLLLGVCAVAMIAVLRTVRKAATRLLLVGVLFCSGIGLWIQREELQDCRGQCTCRLFGQDVDMPDLANGNCPE
jgi:hypothetical protein